MSVVTITCTTYGALWVAVPFVRVALEDSIQWYKTVGITSNRLAYQEIAIWTRALLESDGQIMKQHFTGFAYTLPFIGIQLFLFFGLGSEVRKTYVGWFRDFFRLHSNKRSFAWLKGLIGIAIRGATQLGILAGNLKLKRRQLQVDANTFTPFQKEDIVLNDLSAPWHSTIAPPLPSVIPSSAPVSSKRPLVAAPSTQLWREYRKELISTTVQQQQETDRRDQLPQQGHSSKTRVLQGSPAYVVYTKTSQ
ncbi:hypothetical protein FRC19_000607 [Serendipita sp. 401]|nr:hypothetical protein FRC19_000607 [Serendipita sp. 401]KAG9042188.1 hypothetical protein FS842_002271 [Serendipita sp. 407]